MAPWEAAVRAAQEPRPANGFRGMPSTLTGTSFRGHSIRTTPSFVVAFVPEALAIFWASTWRSPWARANHPAPALISTGKPMAMIRLSLLFMGFLLSGLVARPHRSPAPRAGRSARGPGAPIPERQVTSPGTGYVNAARLSTAPAEEKRLNTLSESHQTP